MTSLGKPRLNRGVFFGTYFPVKFVAFCST